MLYTSFFPIPNFFLDTMKRTIAAVLAFSTMALAQQDSCPCFSAHEYEDIVKTYPQIGCQFSETKANDPETISMAVTYLWHHQARVGVIQAGVTVEQLDGHNVLGGLCGIGSRKKFPVKSVDVKDYGDNEHSPEAFQACYDIMIAKCKDHCDSFVKLGEGRTGCGHLPFATSAAN